MTQTTGTMWRQYGVETTETTAMGGVETTWRPFKDYGDDMGMTGTMWR